MRSLPCVLLLLAGCQMPPPVVAASPVQFELTDLSTPDRPNATTYEAGQVVDVGLVFDVDVGLVGPDMTGVRLDRLHVTSYTPNCDGQPVPELYRTKVIVYPEAVTDAPASPSRLGYRLPLSTRTLMELGLCNAQRPQTGLFRIHADLANSPPADLLIRVNGGGEPPTR